MSAERLVAPTWVITCAECHGGGEEKSIGIFRHALVETCEWCGKPIEKGKGHVSQGAGLLEAVFERINETSSKIWGPHPMYNKPPGGG